MVYNSKNTYFWYVVVFVLALFAGLGLGTSILGVIDKKLAGVQFKLPDSRFYIVGDKVLGIKDLKIKKDKTQRRNKWRQSKTDSGVIEGFDDGQQTSGTTTTVPTVSTAPVPTTVTLPPTLPAGGTAAVPTPMTTVVPPELPIPQPTGVAQTPLATPVVLPPVVSVQQPIVSEQDKSSFVATNRKQCDETNRPSFQSLQRKSCRAGERGKYDINSPEHLRMELELLELRRQEIANKLDVNLNKGFQIGCTSDADCNQVNTGSEKNLCRVDNTCACNNGNGTFCQFPANYKDPNTMTPLERQRFKNQNDLSRFTVADYRNWLLLYRDTPNELTPDHAANFQKILKGDSVTATDIPRARLSPPPNSADVYLKLLDGHADSIKFTNSDTAGPYLASNYTSYDQFLPPADLKDYRVVNPDDLVKKPAPVLGSSNGRQ